MANTVSFILSINDHRTGTFALAFRNGLIRTKLMFPIGSPGGEDYIKYKGKYVVSTILHWLDWEAHENKSELRNDGTRNIQMIYLFLKYFGGDKAHQIIDLNARIPETNKEFTFAELVKEYGFYSDHILGGIHDMQSNAIIWLQQVDKGTNRYKISKMQDYEGNELQVGSIIEINAGLVFLEESGKLTQTSFIVGNASKDIAIQGPPSFTEAPQSAAMSGKMSREVNSGGIDLTAAKGVLETEMDSCLRGNDNGIKFHLSPAMLKRLQNAPGFVPVIISIQPLADLRSFLGLKEQKSIQSG